VTSPGFGENLIALQRAREHAVIQAGQHLIEHPVVQRPRRQPMPCLSVLNRLLLVHRGGGRYVGRLGWLQQPRLPGRRRALQQRQSFRPESGPAPVWSSWPLSASSSSSAGSRKFPTTNRPRAWPEASPLLSNWKWIPP
jgi:hypothetical protein